MSNVQKATIGGGCFWCVEAVVKRLRGVLAVEPGYAGGEKPNPTYKEVCSGTTGHAEVVQVTFDPEEIGYDDLLRVFFATHDPTTKDRQGADVGTQYRSVIFYHDEDQKRTAEEIRAEVDASDAWSDPIVTEISPLSNYSTAESYHHDYFDNNRTQPYCMAVIDPKVRKLMKDFSDRVAAE